MNLVYLLCGSVTVSTDYDNITSLLNLCMYCDIPYSDFTALSDKIQMTFRLSNFKRMSREADARSIKYTIERKGGIPVFLERYKHRYGIFLGVILGISIIFLSQQYIWSIDVTGNEKITREEIKETLDKYGFSVGTYIRSVNTNKIENRILIDNDNISWISINIVGTVAEVQIREYEKASLPDSSENPANLIASKSGIVEEVRIYRGNVVVSSGQFVDKGDLLVSGLFDSNIEGFRYTRASGEVMARTVSEFFIEIPYEYESISYTGVEYCDKNLNFFDFSIKFSKKGGNDGVLYDKIEMVENLTFPDGTPLPISIHTVKYMEYELIPAKRTKEEAEELAYFELEKKLGEFASRSVILKKSITPNVKENSFSIYCVVTAIENIAKTSEFQVDITRNE